MKSVKLQITVSEKSNELLNHLVKKLGLRKSILIDLSIKELARKELEQDKK